MLTRYPAVFLILMSFLLIKPAHSGGGYWGAALGFQIEGESDLSKTQIFVAAQVHALLEADKYLKKQKKKNYYCSSAELTTREVFRDLKDSGLFKGVVQAEAVTSFIAATLQNKYPCAGD